MVTVRPAEVGLSRHHRAARADGFIPSRPFLRSLGRHSGTPSEHMHLPAAPRRDQPPIVSSVVRQRRVLFNINRALHFHTIISCLCTASDLPLINHRESPRIVPREEQCPRPQILATQRPSIMVLHPPELEELSRNEICRCDSDAVTFVHVER